MLKVRVGRMEVRNLEGAGCKAEREGRLYPRPLITYLGIKLGPAGL